ncbi:hypothetical protein Tco_0647924 [Tanacetum coccineum]
MTWKITQLNIPTSSDDSNQVCQPKPSGYWGKYVTYVKQIHADISNTTLCSDLYSFSKPFEPHAKKDLSRISSYLLLSSIDALDGHFDQIANLLTVVSQIEVSTTQTTAPDLPPNQGLCYGGMYGHLLLLNQFRGMASRLNNLDSDAETEIDDITDPVLISILLTRSQDVQLRCTELNLVDRSRQVPQRDLWLFLIALKLTRNPSGQSSCPPSKCSPGVITDKFIGTPPRSTSAYDFCAKIVQNLNYALQSDGRPFVHSKDQLFSEGAPAVTESLLPHQIPLPDTSDSDIETLFDNVDSNVFDTYTAPETDSEASSSNTVNIDVTPNNQLPHVQKQAFRALVLDLGTKARLVAEGYRQEAGIDLSESFAPVARLASDQTHSLLQVASMNLGHLQDGREKPPFLNGD